MALPATIEPRDDLCQRRAAVKPVELGSGVHQRSLAAVGQALLVGIGVSAFDHAPDRQPEGAREGVVALVVRGHGHDRARAVLHQHVVGHVHRDALAVDRIDHGPPERDAGLWLVEVASLLAGLGDRVIDVVAHLPLVLGALGQAQHIRVLGGHHEEGSPEQRVGTGGEHGVVDAQFLAAKRHLGSLRAPDPVALHRLHVLRPVDPIEVAQQPLGVVGYAEEPLLELPDFDQRAAALAATFGVHLLVGEHGLVFGAPLHRRLLAIRQAALVQAQEDPLRPAVVARFLRAELA